MRGGECNQVSIPLLVWYYSPHASLGIGGITTIAGDYVHVAVEHRLAGGFAYVDAYVIAVRVICLVEFLLYVLSHDVHGLALGEGGKG